MTGLIDNIVATFDTTLHDALLREEQKINIGGRIKRCELSLPSSTRDAAALPSTRASSKTTKTVCAGVLVCGVK